MQKISGDCVLPEKTVQTEKVDSGQHQLTYQNSPEISLHTEPRNGKKYKGQTNQQTDHVGEKDPSGHSQPL